MLTLFIMCPGLGHIGRGYESFTREQFDILKDTKDYDMHLFKGAGNSDEKEHAVFCLKRTGRLTKMLSKITGLEPYAIEQLTFAIASIPWLIRKKPEVILYSDFIFGVYLWHIRKFLNFKYKLLFTNGAPNGPPYTRCDHVQQLLPSLFKLGIDAGEPASRFTLLPLGAHVSKNFNWPSAGQKSEWKTELGLPDNKKIIISVGAINSHHKRMDYLVREFSRLPSEDFFLLVLGNLEEKSSEIMDLARTVLPESSYSIRTVPFSDIHKFYLCADVFSLCSLTEGFGRVYLEALMFGLPVFAHDYAISREVMKEMGIYVDMAVDGALSDAIMAKQPEVYTKEQKREFVFREYDWSVLKGRYEDMIRKVS